MRNDDESGPLFPTLAQVDLFTGTPFLQGDMWMRAQGQQLSKSSNQGLYFLITPPPLSPQGNFALPALDSPARGVEYYIATAGDWPVRFD